MKAIIIILTCLCCVNYSTAKPKPITSYTPSRTYDGEVEVVRTKEWKLYWTGSPVIKYPHIARRRGEEGSCVLSFIITQEGEVANLEILNGQLSDGFRGVLHEFESQTHFAPTPKNHKRTPVRVELSLVFKLCDT